jgi:hypothetical protein
VGKVGSTGCVVALVDHSVLLVTAILVQEIFFNTETENYQISHTDLISGKTQHTLFPSGYFLSKTLLC